MKKLVKVVSEVRIDTITQQDLEQMIIDRIVAENPEVNVENIEFVQRRDPARIEVNVKATLGAVEPKVIETPEEIVEAEPVPEMEPETATVGDIFGGN